MSTPKQLEKAYLRLWDPSIQREHPLRFEAGVPSSSLILDEYNNITNSVIMYCFQAQGCVIPGSGNGAGKWKEEGMPHCKRGGARSQKE
eukprot:2585058-Ditylum_brightwellii.AAC.1